MADFWNSRLELWTFVAGAPLAREVRRQRLLHQDLAGRRFQHRQAVAEWVPIKNLASDPDLPASAQVATDFLQLVRYGLRAADDPHIRDSLKVVDAC